MRGSRHIALTLRAICILYALSVTVSAASPPTGNASSGLLELPGLPAPAAHPTPAAPATPAIPSPAPAAAAPVTPAAAIAPPPTVAPPPAAPTPAASARPSPPPALPPAAATDPAVTLANNPDVILIPLRLTDTSLMFNGIEMKLVKSVLDTYDSAAHPQKTEMPKEENDLTSLLESLKTPQKDAPPPPAMPNLYLGSIVYYSASHWSVWIDGRKLVNAYNAPQNPLYVSRLSRNEVELVWKPAAIADIISLWRERTAGGKNPIPNIHVDEHSGAITLRLRPNQTFVPQNLTIYEGLVKSTMALPPQPATSAETISPFSLQPRGTMP